MTVTSPGGNFASMSTSAERMRRLRERRTAALIPVDGPTPLPEADQLAPAVEEALTALKLGERDAAAAQLARRYAAAIDQAADPAYALRWLGPLLLRTLGELQATPAAHPARKPERSRPNQIERLRAAQAASRRVEALERLRAAQLERGGKRDAAVKAAAGDLKSIAAGLAATRDAVAAAAAAHLKALAALAMATDQHNARLAEGRALLAERGLRVRDDLVDEGLEHAEGCLDSQGMRAGNVDWTPVPAAGIAAHALRLVFAGFGPLHPLAQIGKYTWRPFEVEGRPDKLRVPALADVGARIPPGPSRAVMPERLSVAETVARPPESLPGGYYRDPPPRRAKAAAR